MLRLGERAVTQLQRFIEKYCETRNAMQERCGFGKKCRRGMRACIGESNIGLPYVGLPCRGETAPREKPRWCIDSRDLSGTPLPLGIC